MHAPESRGLVLALGGGGARGIAHIGVLQVLHEHHVPVRAVAGTSIGAEIGAFVARGMPIDELAALGTALDWRQVLQLFLPDLPAGGLVSGRRIMDFLGSRLGEGPIEDLAIGFAAVATDLETGEQVVLERGSLLDAVRASISLPGVLMPYRIGARVLIDGGVVNPVPFDVARECFGGPVLAVAVHSGARGLTHREMRGTESPQWRTRARQLLDQPWVRHVEPLRAWLVEQLAPEAQGDMPEWRALHVLDRVLDITQAQLVRLRSALQPPDVTLLPDVHDIGPMEFYRGHDALAAGRAAATARLDEIRKLVE